MIYNIYFVVRIISIFVMFILILITNLSNDCRFVTFMMLSETKCCLFFGVRTFFIRIMKKLTFVFILFRDRGGGTSFLILVRLFHDFLFIVGLCTVDNHSLIAQF